MKRNDYIEFFLGIILVFVAGFSLDLSNTNQTLISVLLALSGFENVCRGVKVEFYQSVQPFLSGARWLLLVYLLAKLAFSF